MTFEEQAPLYDAFRLKVIKTILTALPTDNAQCWKERAELEPLFFEAMEFAADMESIYQAAKYRAHEEILKEGYPKSQALELAKVKCHEQHRYRAKSAAAVSAINSRSIKLSQTLKLTDRG